MSPRRATALWVAWCLFYLGGLLAAAGIGQRYPGDESHFIGTSQLFAKGITLDLLRHYPEMSGPLPFSLFGWWGNVFGWQLAVMRMFAVTVAFLTLMLLHRLLRDVLSSEPAALAAGMGLCLNPYMAAMSIFLYTDMIALLFVVLSLIAFQRRSLWLLAVSLACALLCRQYLIFLPLAVMLSGGRSMAIAAAISAGPLAACIALWGGLAPDSNVRRMYLTERFSFHVSAAIGYTGLLFIYLLPFLLVRWRRFVPHSVTAVLAACLSLLYWWFPIRPSRVAFEAGFPTVGIFDRALHAVAPHPMLRDVIYWIAFGFGLVVVAGFWRGARRSAGFTQFASIATLCFLSMMPLSYLYWEKYALPVLPIAAIAVLTAPQPSNGPQFAPGRIQ